MQDFDQSDKGSSSNGKGLPDSLVVLLCCFAFGIISMGWKEFFVGLGVMPIGTLAQLLGVAVVPFLAGWVLAKIGGFLAKSAAFRNLWLAGATLIFLLMLIGQYRAATGTQP